MNSRVISFRRTADAICRTRLSLAMITMRSTLNKFNSRGHLQAMNTGDCRCLVAVTAIHEGASGQHRRVPLVSVRSRTPRSTAERRLQRYATPHPLTMARCTSAVTITHGNLKTRDLDRHQNPGPHMYAWSRMFSSIWKLL
jgi:hypothetical protein